MSEFSHDNQIQVCQRMLDHQAYNSLTKKQQETVELLAFGATLREAAKILKVSYQSVANTKLTAYWALKRRKT